ncbi:MAG: radical SAM protein [Spirochaetia bacterium]
MRVAEFALTNICTAKCSFCSIWSQKEKYTVDTQKAIATVSKLKELGVNFITLTGGEPLLHPDFKRIAAQCAKEKMITTTITADPRVLKPKRLDILAETEIDIMGISIDHHIEDVAFKARKIPDAIKGIETGLKELKKRKIFTTACVLISDFNHRELPDLMKKCSELGFDSISMNYPVFSQSPTYTLGGEAIKLSKEELIAALREILRLKKDYNIVNPAHSIKNIITYLEGNKPRYTCLGGYRSLFVDWKFQTFPCMFFEKSMGDVLELKKKDIKKTSCNLCNMSWYRDFSIYFQGLKSVVPLFKELGRIASFK